MDKYNPGTYLKVKENGRTKVHPSNEHIIDPVELRLQGEKQVASTWLLGYSTTDRAVCQLIFLLDFLLEFGNEFINSHRSHLAFAAAADGHRTIRSFLFTDNEHIGNFLDLTFADLVANLFIAVVEVGTDAKGFHLVHDRFAYSLNLSVIGMTRTCSGASQAGKASA